ncbi:NosD domain-containing protein [Micromonospora zhanjiangensis]|uniref:NosD domain-containing protein n=1 Tax=Micromonospora zhanjiangensis TaxID=1522057 RepID=A0ABV8KR73_9ACTN
MARERLLTVLLAVSALLVMPATPAVAAPVVACGATLTASVTLRADLNCTGDGLIVGADGVTVNLNGHVIGGPRTGVGTGIATTSHHNVRITNGTVHSFGRGVALSNVNGATLTNVQLLYNGLTASSVTNLRITGGLITDPPTGPVVSVQNTVTVSIDRVEVLGDMFFTYTAGVSISNSTLHIGNLGFATTGQVAIRNNLLTDRVITLSQAGNTAITGNDSAGGGISVALSNGVLVQNNRLRASQYGVVVSTAPSYDLRVQGNFMDGNEYGVSARARLLTDLSGLTVTGNTLTGNHQAAVFVEAAQITPSAAVAPAQVPSPLTISGNQMRANGFGSTDHDAAGRVINDGLHTNVPTGSPVVVGSNQAFANAEYGIEAAPNGTVQDAGGNVSIADPRGCLGVTCATA